MIPENNGWESVGERYQKTIINRSGRPIWVMLWYDKKQGKWCTGEVYGNSYANVKQFKTLEEAFQS